MTKEYEDLKKRWAEIEEEKAGKIKDISEKQKIIELRKKIKDYEFSKTKTGVVVQNLKTIGVKIFAQPKQPVTKNKKLKQKIKTSSGLTMDDLMKM